MATGLNARLARLDLRLHLAPIPCAFDSEQAAHAAGVRGGWLHIGDVMDAGEWMAAARAQQSALCSEVPHAAE